MRTQGRFAPGRPGRALTRSGAGLIGIVLATGVGVAAVRESSAAPLATATSATPTTTAPAGAPDRAAVELTLASLMTPLLWTGESDQGVTRYGQSVATAGTVVKESV